MKKSWLIQTFFGVFLGMLLVVPWATSGPIQQQVGLNTFHIEAGSPRDRAWIASCDGLDSDSDGTPLQQPANPSDCTYPEVQNMEALFDGTNYNRAREVKADGSTLTGIKASGPMLFNGTTFDRTREIPSADAQTRTGFAGTGPILFNGTTFDRARSAQITSSSTPMPTGVVPSALYAYDANGASVNTYKPVGIYSNRALVFQNISSGVTNITTNTDTLLDAGAVNNILLIRVTVGVAGTGTARLTIRSEPDGAAPCGGTVLATLDTTAVRQFELGIVNGNDLCLTTAATAAADLSVLSTADVD